MSQLIEGEAVELIGVPRLLGSPIVAPISGAPCVAYCVKVRVYTRLDIAGIELGQFFRCASAGFVLSTDSGDVNVFDQPGTVDVESRLVVPSMAAAEAFLAAQNLQAYARSSFFDEGFLRVDERVTVRGVIAREPEAAVAESTFRELAMRTFVRGYGKHPLVIGRA